MKRASFAGCFVVILVGLISGLYYLSTQIPDIAEQMPPNALPIVVTLTAPSNDALIPLNDATTIGVEAIGPQPIVAVELWVDGTRSFAKKSDVGLKQFAATWSWVPPSEGSHTLIARAVDAQQREGQSNFVRVLASKDANPTTQMAYKARAGDTVSAIAQKFKVPPQQLIDANPQISPNVPLPAGQDVSVPISGSLESGPGVESSSPEPSTGTPSPEPPSSGQGVPPSPLDKNIFWFKSIANLSSKSNPPVKPDLAAGVDGCTVKLTISDHSFNEDGFYLYRQGKKPLLKPIALLAAHDGATPFLYSDSDLTLDTYTYYVVAFNPGGNALSNLLQVQVGDGKCKKQENVLEDPILKITQPVDMVYCYLKIGNGDWQRVPHAPNTFLSPGPQGTFDVSAYLKSLSINTFKSKITLELDCWGWKGSALVYLGNAKETAGPGTLKVKGAQFEFTGLVPQPDLLTGGVPGITPSPEQFLEGSVSSIAPPTQLTNTDNPQVCTKHMPGVLAILGGEFACKQAITAGNYAVLVWEWTGGCWPGDSNCTLTIDGFRVYREDFPAPAVVKETQEQGLKTAIFALPLQMWPPGPNDSTVTKLKYAALSKNCYFVRAFKDGVGESGDSNHVCLPFDSGIKKPQTTKIPATDWLTRYVYKEECNSFQGLEDMHGLATSAGPDQIEVGYYYTTDGCNLAWVARGAVWFDTSGIPANAWIVKSTLQYALGKTKYSGDIATNEFRSCANRLMVGTQKWMGIDFGEEKYWIPGESYANLPTYLVSQSVATDVTSAVKEWVQGTQPNYGFVFRQSQEGMHTDWDSACTSIYKDFSLEVTYFP